MFNQRDTRKNIKQKTTMKPWHWKQIESTEQDHRFNKVTLTVTIKLSGQVELKKKKTQ